jgi:hypothetical protein
MSDEEDEEVREIRHFISLAPTGDNEFYGVMTVYEETDALNAVGGVYRFWLDEENVPSFDASLNTNDGLDNIWASPQGNLWVGSVHGRIWTTAKVSWKTKHPQIDSDQSDPRFKWRVTDAPEDPNGGGYNIAAIWGSSDSDVHFVTFEGTILHWDGKSFSVGYDATETPLSVMHGTGAKDVWAAGRDGLVLHFDGKSWRRVPLPGDAGAGETLSGIWCVSASEVYICSTSGAIFHGSANGLERLGEYKYSFYGIVGFQKRLLLAAGDDGVAELKGNKVKVIRDTFDATGIFALQDMVGFVEPSQEAPRAVVYDPREDPPWSGWGG